MLLVGCARPAETRYTATYVPIQPKGLAMLAVQATMGAGYAIAKAEQKLHWFAFMTIPKRLAAADTVDTAFVVHLIFDLETRGRYQFTVEVAPRAFDGTQEVSADRLPASAPEKAAALARAIRAGARQYEAPL